MVELLDATFALLRTTPKQVLLRYVVLFVAITKLGGVLHRSTIPEGLAWGLAAAPAQPALKEPFDLEVLAARVEAGLPEPTAVLSKATS